jgi:hypothetical protein
MGERIVQEREPEDTLVRRNRRFTAAALGFSDERFLRSGAI